MQGPVPSAPPLPVAAFDTAGFENGIIEGFLGSPIPLFNAGVEPEDSKCVPLYNAFKPTILYFFNMCNNPTEEGNKGALKGIMQEIMELFGYVFMIRANLAGLSPAVPQDIDDESWKDVWFTQLFEVADDRRMSIVIQGGEAVNFYSMYKYTSVPTHDADTRILAGNHFHYFQDISTVPEDIKRLMHQYRFFVAFGLSALLNLTLRDFHSIGSQYMTQFIENWPTDGEEELLNHKSLFVPTLNGKNFYLKILLVGIPNPTIQQGIAAYNIDDDINISRLISVDTKIKFLTPLPQGNYECSIVDLFVPHRVMSTNPMDFGRIGQSDNIHSYFSTDQAMSTVASGTGAPNPAGRIPSVDFDLPLPDGITHFGGPRTIKLRMVPHGFILFETLRMLFVSDAFLRYGNRNKLLKYKQKLVVLLSTLMRGDLSNSIYSHCLGYKAQAPLNPEDEDLRTYLLGGRSAVASRKIEPIKLPQLVKQPPVSMPPSTPIDTDARAFSRSLAVNDSKGEAVTAEGIAKGDETKWAGYFDFLSYTNPDFKDFRLPKSTKDLEEEEAESRLIEELLRRTQKPRSGYRRRTPRSRKTKSKLGPATRRK